MSQSWKRAELKIAQDMGGRRIPATGERDGSDCIAGLFCFQLKVRKALPVWLFTWLSGIVATASRTNQIGVLVLNLPRKPRRDALVIVRWQDWVSLHGATAESTVEDAAALTSEYAKAKA